MIKTGTKIQSQIKSHNSGRRLELIDTSYRQLGFKTLLTSEVITQIYIQNEINSLNLNVKLSWHKQQQLIIMLTSYKWQGSVNLQYSVQWCHQQLLGYYWNTELIDIYKYIYLLLWATRCFQHCNFNTQTIKTM